MSSYIRRLFGKPGAFKRTVSHITQRDAKQNSWLHRLGLGKLIGGTPRAISTTPVNKKVLVDDLELATGIAKREMLLRQKGETDPWMMEKGIRRKAGRQSDPTPIPSAFDGRLVGCSCLNDRFIKWMWLEKGAPKRCECGHYFVLKHVPPI